MRAGSRPMDNLRPLPAEPARNPLSSGQKRRPGQGPIRPVRPPAILPGMDLAALPGILARVHPLFWPGLIVNLWRVTLFLRASGQWQGCRLSIWPDGRVEIAHLLAPRAPDPCAAARGLAALISRNQATASAALLAGGRAHLSLASARTQERFRLQRKRDSGQGPPGGRPAPAEASGEGQTAVSARKEHFRRQRKRDSGQGPPGGQPAPAEASGVSQTAVSARKERFRLQRTRDSGQGPPGGQPAPAEASGVSQTCRERHQAKTDSVKDGNGLSTGRAAATDCQPGSAPRRPGHPRMGNRNDRARTRRPRWPAGATPCEARAPPLAVPRANGNSPAGDAPLRLRPPVLVRRPEAAYSSTPWILI